MLFEQYPESNREKSRYAVVPQVQRYVDRYYFLELSLSQLARIYHYNEKYLGRLFKQQMGMSFNEYLNEKRLEYGKERLRRSKDSVLEISANAGFRNVTYFNRMFKRRYGISPTQYRREPGRSCLSWDRDL
jgi:YesN/AraC family two-component response regulator